MSKNPTIIIKLIYIVFIFNNDGTSGQVFYAIFSKMKNDCTNLNYFR